MPADMIHFQHHLSALKSRYVVILFFTVILLYLSPASHFFGIQKCEVH